MSAQLTNKIFNSNKRILIIGASGFLGSAIVKEAERNKMHILTPSSKELDMMNYDSVRNYLYNYKYSFNTVLFLAAKAGGIGLNQKQPADLTHYNLEMASNFYKMVYNYVAGINSAEFVKKFKIYTVGSICSYPCNTPIPFKEDNLWNGYPEATNAGYGFAKKSLLVLGDAYRKQYDLKSTHFLPVNMFGPKDHFDLENSHVIPALIRKFYEAKINNELKVICWGTGSASREFLYSETCAKIIIKAILNELDTPLPINIGTGQEIKIKDLVSLIANLIGYKGKIIWDTSRPDGQPRRCLDISRMKELIGSIESPSLEDGLKETIKFYEQNRLTILEK